VDRHSSGTSLPVRGPLDPRVWGERSAKGFKTSTNEKFIYRHRQPSRGSGLLYSTETQEDTRAQEHCILQSVAPHLTSSTTCRGSPAVFQEPARRSHIRGLPSMNVAPHTSPGEEAARQSPAEDLCCRGKISLNRSLLQVVIRLLQDNSINSP
jgi:hypothetical protein